jgi:ferrous iron transport protein A
MVYFTITNDNNSHLYLEQPSMTLAEIGPKGRCRIIGAAEDNREFQSRLYALGLYPGVTVDVVHVSPFGDPLQVKVGHTLLSIRKTEAALLKVEEVQ